MKEMDNHKLTTKEYEVITEEVEKIIGEGCQIYENKDWLRLWAVLTQVELFPLTDEKNLIIFKNLYGIRIIINHVLKVCFQPLH